MSGCPADCAETYPHHHEQWEAPNGRLVDVIIHHSDRHPRAEVRDSETGEVIFPAVKGPLTVIRNPEGDHSK
jgi:hypothetical protein